MTFQTGSASYKDNFHTEGMRSVQFFFFRYLMSYRLSFCKVLKFFLPAEISLSLDPSPTVVVAGHSSLNGS